VLATERSEPHVIATHHLAAGPPPGYHRLMPAARHAVAALALALGLATSASAAGRRAAIEDDYARALEAARERGVPIPVDIWAPW
jgi:hypothetical protein